jgi:hypothetical protein
MGKVQLKASNLLNMWATHYAHATLPLEIVVTPHVVVACEEYHLDTSAAKLREATQHTDKTLRYHPTILKPKIENVAKEIYLRGILSHHI